MTGFALLLSAPPGGTAGRTETPAPVVVSLALTVDEKPKREVQPVRVSGLPTERRPIRVSVAAVSDFTPLPDRLPDPRTVPHPIDPPPISPPADGPKIALIIDDMGMDRRRSAQVAALNAPLTLAYLPYARDLPAQTAAARAAGHELLVHIPMESRIATANAGPKVLRASLAQAEISRRLTWALGRFDGFVGVNNHMGSRFTSNPAAMRMLLAELAKRNLLFVDSRTSAMTVARRIANSVGIRFAERDVFLDHDDDEQSIATRFKELERAARRDGVAIGIGHPRDATIAALRQWIPDARKRGFVLVPVSAAAPPRIAPVEHRVTALMAGSG